MEDTGRHSVLVPPEARGVKSPAPRPGLHHLPHGAAHGLDAVGHPHAAAWLAGDAVLHHLGHLPFVERKDPRVAGLQKTSHLRGDEEEAKALPPASTQHCRRQVDTSSIHAKKARPLRGVNTQQVAKHLHMALQELSVVPAVLRAQENDVGGQLLHELAVLLPREQTLTDEQDLRHHWLHGRVIADQGHVREAGARLRARGRLHWRDQGPHALRHVHDVPPQRRAADAHVGLVEIDVQRRRPRRAQPRVQEVAPLPHRSRLRGAPGETKNANSAAAFCVRFFGPCSVAAR